MEQAIALTQQTSLIKSKLKAAGIHLAISGVIFLILAYFIIFRWYPVPYFTADGGWQGIRMVALIDMVLGPLLTLIIFNPAKSLREIRLDLSVIALIQVSALVWGIYTIHNERPAAIVHWDGEFYAVPAKTYTEQNIDINSLEKFSTEKPPVINARRSTDLPVLMEMLRLSTEEKRAPFEQFHLYRSFLDDKDNIFSTALNIDSIISVNEAMNKELDQFLSKHGGDRDDYIYMPLNARYHNVILIFTRQGEVAGSLNAPYKQD